jgi:arylsulfatase A-like enzyme
VRKTPVTLLDLYPTLVELSGLPAKTGIDGETLVPVIRDASSRRNPAVITFLPGNHATVTSQWRYIRYRDGGEELYDRIADPNELRNLARQEQYADLKRELGAFMPKVSAPPKPERSQYDFDYKSYTWRLRQ